MRKNGGVIGLTTRVWRWTALYPSLRLAAAGLLCFFPMGTLYCVIETYRMADARMPPWALVPIGLLATYLFPIGLLLLIVALPLGAWDLYRQARRRRG